MVKFSKGIKIPQCFSCDMIASGTASITLSTTDNEITTDTAVQRLVMGDSLVNKPIQNLSIRHALADAMRLYKNGKNAEDEDNVSVCYHCAYGGDLILCDDPHCAHCYHAACVGLAHAPQGKWICPWHRCEKCGKDASRQCILCPRAYCSNHTPKDILTFAETQRFICCPTCHDILVWCRTPRAYCF